MVGGAPISSGRRTFPLIVMPTDYYAELDKEELENTPSDSQTTLVPKSLIGGDVEIGETITFKVEHVYEDEVEVSLVSKKENVSEQPPEDELDSYMTKG